MRTVSFYEVFNNPYDYVDFLDPLQYEGRVNYMSSLVGYFIQQDAQWVLPYTETFHHYIMETDAFTNFLIKESGLVTGNYYDILMLLYIYERRSNTSPELATEYEYYISTFRLEPLSKLMQSLSTESIIAISKVSPSPLFELFNYPESFTNILDEDIGTVGYVKTILDIFSVNDIRYELPKTKSLQTYIDDPDYISELTKNLKDKDMYDLLTLLYFNELKEMDKLSNNTSDDVSGVNDSLVAEFNYYAYVLDPEYKQQVFASLSTEQLNLYLKYAPVNGIKADTITSILEEQYVDLITSAYLKEISENMTKDTTDAFRKYSDKLSMNYRLRVICSLSFDELITYLKYAPTSGVLKSISVMNENVNVIDNLHERLNGMLRNSATISVDNMLCIIVYTYFITVGYCDAIERIHRTVGYV